MGFFLFGIFFSFFFCLLSSQTNWEGRLGIVPAECSSPCWWKDRSHSLAPSHPAAWVCSCACLGGRCLQMQRVLGCSVLGWRCLELLGLRGTKSFSLTAELWLGLCGAACQACGSAAFGVSCSPSINSTCVVKRALLKSPLHHESAAGLPACVSPHSLVARSYGPMAPWAGCPVPHSGTRSSRSLQPQCATQ